MLYTGGSGSRNGRSPCKSQNNRALLFCVYWGCCRKAGQVGNDTNGVILDLHSLQREGILGLLLEQLTSLENLGLSRCHLSRYNIVNEQIYRILFIL